MNSYGKYVFIHKNIMYRIQIGQSYIVLDNIVNTNVESYIWDNMLENHHNPKHMERNAKNH